MRKLGQHMLISNEIAVKVTELSRMKSSDTVFEIGTGQGILTRCLSENAREVITCEVDPNLFLQTSRMLAGLQNVKFIFGDAFSPPVSETQFDVCVTSLPYSRSRDFVEWLALANGRSFRSSTAIVQAEFAQKLTASPGEEDYRAISVLAQILFVVEEEMRVGRGCFYPEPRVDSEVISFIPKADVNLSRFSSAGIKLINSIFSFRGRLLSSAIKKIPVLREKSERIPDDLKVKRVERLRPVEFLQIWKVTVTEE